MESSTTFTIPSSPSPERREEPRTSPAGPQESSPEADNDHQPPVQNDKMESSSELSFKKKDVRSSRAQSFQSVLSTASLKSLKQQYANSQANTTATASRQNSIAGNLNHAHSKNFQSYIQAPVFSSISSYKPDEVEIGQQLPFHHEKPKSPQPASKTETPQNSEETQEDQDTVLQQHKLTLNALKKLSLSPMLASHPKEVQLGNVSFKENESTTLTEPYQPAEVDLSSFASLTRQPKSSHLSKTPQESTPTSALTSHATTAKTTEPIQPPEKQAVESPTKYSPISPVMPTPKRADVPKPTAITNRAPGAQSSNATTSLPSSLMTTRNVHPGTLKSPTNEVPQKSKHLQQIKGLRSPMYIPAVLRRTQNENGEMGRRDRKHDGVEMRPTHACEVPVEHFKSISSQASIKSIESNASVESASSSISPYRNISHRNYNNVLSLAPTRKHWVKDEAVSKCGIADCPKTFNFFERRHHCRRCGGIFCKEHTMHYLYINHLAQFTTGGRGTLSKVCDNCIEEYNEFVKHEFGVDVHHPHHSTPATSATSPIDSTPAAANQLGRRGFTETTNNEQMAGSVPANWSWSSF
ncbi:hypothetical protein JA9_002895 [Meyerozyma sp. JA9]|nr:hypothetical protein JA9_002895 [Meyerozyma sp. JA9]